MINELLTKKAEMGNLKILEKINLLSGKTKDMIHFLSSLGIDGGTLMILDKDLSNSSEAEKIYNAGRNVSFLSVNSIEKINAFMILKYKWIVMTKRAFEELENRLDFIKEEGEENKKIKKQEIKEEIKPVIKEKSIKKVARKTVAKKLKAN